LNTEALGQHPTNSSRSDALPETSVYANTGHSSRLAPGE
jgi:hypothetical protein